jgi:hypothetical protein
VTRLTGAILFVPAGGAGCGRRRPRAGCSTRPPQRPRRPTTASGSSTASSTRISSSASSEGSAAPPVGGAAGATRSSRPTSSPGRSPGETHTHSTRPLLLLLYLRDLHPLFPRLTSVIKYNDAMVKYPLSNETI